MATCPGAPHSTGIALFHAIPEYQRGFAMGLRAVRRVTITCIRSSSLKKLQTTDNPRSALWSTPAVQWGLVRVCIRVRLGGSNTRHFSRRFLIMLCLTLCSLLFVARPPLLAGWPLGQWKWQPAPGPHIPRGLHYFTQYLSTSEVLPWDCVPCVGSQLHLFNRKIKKLQTTDNPRSALW